MRTYLRAFAVVLMMTAAAAAKEAPVHLERIKLPPGFNISVYARVDNARSLALSPSGVLYVGNRDNGAVYAVRPGNGKVGGQVVRLAEGLNMPNGVAFRDGDLYVAEVSRVLRFRAIEKNLAAPPTPEVVRDDFPEERSHGWKFIAFGPDGKLYVPVGAPCNVCEPKGEIFSTITRMNPDGSRREIYARGVRNTVGFDWEPGTGALWFTDNGRDRLGNDWPPDELNRAPKAGLHFGFPYCHGGGRPDPEFGDGKDCASFVPPQKELGPHVAALGMRFYTGKMFPVEHRGRVFIAEHGSWNRDTKIGYRVMTVDVKDGKAGEYRVFAEGWLNDGKVWGRPVDVLVMPDGALLVSDDYAGAVYRISYAP